jgi:hypothetical protein
MKEKIVELKNKYQMRVEFLEEDIKRLRTIDRPTTKEINDLRIVTHARILWKEVIQDLKKIADKNSHELL